MEKSTVEVIVKIYAILGWIGAVLTILGALGMMAGGALIGSMGGAMFGPLGGLAGAFAIIAGIFLIAIAIFGIFVATGIWKLKNWARITMIILAWIGGVMTIIGLLSAVASFSLGLVLWDLSVVAIYAFTIWFFQFVPETKALFAGAPVKAAKKK